MWPFAKRRQHPQDKEWCSFCGKSQDDVRKLIAGPRVYICDECIDLCNDIIAEECDQKTPGAMPEPSHVQTVVHCRLCGAVIDAGERVSIPERGFLCRACIGVVREVGTSSD